MNVFDLEKALKGEPMITRSGNRVLSFWKREVSEMGVFEIAMGYYYEAVINNVGRLSFKGNGMNCADSESEHDLFMVFSSN